VVSTSTFTSTLGAVLGVRSGLMLPPEGFSTKAHGEALAALREPSARLRGVFLSRKGIAPKPTIQPPQNVLYLPRRREGIPTYTVLDTFPREEETKWIH